MERFRFILSKNIYLTGKIDLSSEEIMPHDNSLPSKTPFCNCAKTAIKFKDSVSEKNNFFFHISKWLINIKFSST